MKILATAHPNWEYEHFNNLKNVVMQARLVGNKIMFYEIWDNPHATNKEKIMTTELVLSMFALNKTLKRERPFIKKGNVDFYTVLFRHKKRYKDAFQVLLNKEEKKFKRTKFRRTK